MTPFEKAVKAAAQAIYSKGDFGLLGDRVDSLQAIYLDQARAAILAALPHLREPSEAMRKAGARSQETSWPVADDRWYAMFDAMMKEIGNG